MVYEFQAPAPELVVAELSLARVLLALRSIDGPALLRGKKHPGRSRGIPWQNCGFLEEIPEKLVVHFVMELHFLRLDEGTQGPRTTVR